MIDVSELRRFATDAVEFHCGVGAKPSSLYAKIAVNAAEIIALVDAYEAQGRALATALKRVDFLEGTAWATRTAMAEAQIEAKGREIAALRAELEAIQRRISSALAAGDRK